MSGRYRRRSLWAALPALAIPIVLWLAGPSRVVESAERTPRSESRPRTGERSLDYVVSVIAHSLGRPQGIALDGEGDLVIAQSPTGGLLSGSGAVATLDPEGGELRLVYLDQPAPTRVSTDPDGAVYWTSQNAGAIFKLPRGRQQPETIVSGLKNPSGIAVDGKGQVFFTEVTLTGQTATAGALSKFDGASTTLLSDAEADPNSVAVGPEGDLFWTSSAAGAILHLGRAGKKEVLLSDLERPVGIALDARGARLAYTEVPTPGLAGDAGGRNRVSVLDLKTMERTLVYTGDPEPLGVAIASDGTVYWSSASRGEILEARRRASERPSCGRGDDDDSENEGDDAKSRRERNESVLRARTRLTGANAVPPVDTKASGRACFVLRGVESGSDQGDAEALSTLTALAGVSDPRLDFTLNVKKITGVMQAHIHLGPPGANGPIVAYLFDSPNPTGTVKGRLASGTVRPVDLVGPLAGDWNGFVTDFGNGQLYVNVHTEAHPEGEIRGQILPKGAANHPPNGRIVSPPEDVAVATGEPVFFAGTASDPDGDMVTVLWDFGDGATSTALTPGNHSYSNPGTFTVTFTATDSRGLSDPKPPHRAITVTGGPVATPTPTATPTQPPGATSTPTPTQTPTQPPGATSTPTPTQTPTSPPVATPTPTPTQTPTSPPVATSTPTATPTSPPSTTLSFLQTSIFTASCIGCHSGAGATAGLDLSAGQSYSNLVNVTATTQSGTRVIPFNPDQSVLVLKLASGHRSVPVASQNNIRNWISAGALNN